MRLHKKLRDSNSPVSGKQGREYGRSKGAQGKKEDANAEEEGGGENVDVSKTTWRKRTRSAM